MGSVEEAAQAAGLTYEYDDRGFAVISDSAVTLSDVNRPLLSNYMLYDRPTGTEIMNYMDENWTEDKRFRILPVKSDSAVFLSFIRQMRSLRH